MPIKSYDVARALQQIQAAWEGGVRGNNTDFIEWGNWSGAPATEAEIDAAGAAWEANKDDVQAEENLLSDRLLRVLFEINFDQENRIRALESQPAVTKQQYKTALINLYKSTA